MPEAQGVGSVELVQHTVCVHIICVYISSVCGCAWPLCVYVSSVYMRVVMRRFRFLSPASKGVCWGGRALSVRTCYNKSHFCFLSPASKGACRGACTPSSSSSSSSSSTTPANSRTPAAGAHADAAPAVPPQQQGQWHKTRSAPTPPPPPPPPISVAVVFTASVVLFLIGGVLQMSVWDCDREVSSVQKSGCRDWWQLSISIPFVCFVVDFLISFFFIFSFFKRVHVFAEAVCCVDAVQTKAWVHDWGVSKRGVFLETILQSAQEGNWGWGGGGGGVLVHLMHFSSCSMTCTLDKASPHICFENWFIYF